MAVDPSKVGIVNLKGAIDLGQQTLRSLGFANGGAVVAILTFYGNVVKDGAKVPIDVRWVTAALETFAWGLGLAVAAACAAYVGQIFVATNQPDDWITDAEKRSAYTTIANKRSAWALRFAVALALASLILFGRGTMFATWALSRA
jgi:hypothetical protein